MKVSFGSGCCAIFALTILALDAQSADFEFTTLGTRDWIASISNLQVDGTSYDIYFRYADFAEIIEERSEAEIFRFWGDEPRATRFALAAINALNETDSRFVTFDEALSESPGASAVAAFSIPIGPVTSAGSVPVRWIRNLEKDNFEWTETDWLMPQGGGKPWAIIVESGTLPNAIDDIYSADNTGPTRLNVLQNDLHLRNSPYVVTVIRPPRFGVASAGSDNIISYSADPGFAGDDSIAYQLVDRDGNSAAAVAEIAVTRGPSSSGGGAVGPITIFLLVVMRLRPRARRFRCPNRESNWSFLPVTPNRRRQKPRRL